MVQNLYKNWLQISKIIGIWITSDKQWKVQKVEIQWAIFIWKLHCAKYLMFDLKKYRGVIFHDTEGWCKIWRKTDLWFGKWHEEYGKFSPEHLKVSKLGFWWDPLIQCWKSMSLKFTEELCVMTMRNDAKFEEELTCHFKVDIRNLTNFDPSTWKTQKSFILMCSFWAKYILLELKTP